MALGHRCRAPRSRRSAPETVAPASPRPASTGAPVESTGSATAPADVAKADGAALDPRPKYREMTIPGRDDAASRAENLGELRWQQHRGSGQGDDARPDRIGGVKRCRRARRCSDT